MRCAAGGVVPLVSSSTCSYGLCVVWASCGADACCVLQMAMGNTSVPYFLASGAQELLQAPEVRAEAARSAPHQARVRVTYTNAPSAVVLVPSILAAILFAGVVAALTFKFIRTRSHRRRSLPSTMDKSMSGTVRASF